MKLIFELKNKKDMTLKQKQKIIKIIDEILQIKQVNKKYNFWIVSLSNDQ